MLSVMDIGITAFERAFRSKFEGVLADVQAASGVAAAKMLKEQMRAAYDPDQPRGENGQWGSGGSNSVHAGTDYTASELEQISEYQNGVGVNNLLRDSNDPNALSFVKSVAEQRLRDPLYRKQIEALDSAIDRGSLNEDTVLYRGVKGDLARMPDEGETFTDHGYMATSHKEDVAKGFGDTVLEIHAPKGTKALDVNKALGSKSRYTQDEILLPRGLKLRVRSKTEKRVVVEVVKSKHREASTRVLEPKIKGFAFDATNPRAVEWVEEHTAELLNDLSKRTRDAIKDLVETSFEGEFDVHDLADQINDLIGDESRAETIARTETMLASNEGQQEAWNQAVDEGLLNGTESKEWIVTPDDRLCPICEPMDGQTVPLNENFTQPDTNEEVDVPPMHPRCRCTVGLSL